MKKSTNRMVSDCNKLFHNECGLEGSRIKYTVHNIMKKSFHASNFSNNVLMVGIY